MKYNFHLLTYELFKIKKKNCTTQYCFKHIFSINEELLKIFCNIFCIIYSLEKKSIYNIFIQFNNYKVVRVH